MFDSPIFQKLTVARQTRAQLDRYTHGRGKHNGVYQELLGSHHPCVHWMQELHVMWYSQYPLMMGQEAILYRGINAGVDVDLAKHIAHTLTFHATAIIKLLRKMVAESHLVLGDTECWCELSLEYEASKLAMDTALEQAMTAVIERSGKTRSVLTDTVKEESGQKHMTTKQSIMQALKLNLSQLKEPGSHSSISINTLGLSTSPSSSSTSPSQMMSPRSPESDYSGKSSSSCLSKSQPRSVPASPRDHAVGKESDKLRTKLRNRKKRISLPSPFTEKDNSTLTRDPTPVRSITK